MPHAKPQPAAAVAQLLSNPPSLGPVVVSLPQWSDRSGEKKKKKRNLREYQCQTFKVPPGANQEMEASQQRKKQAIKKDKQSED